MTHDADTRRTQGRGSGKLILFGEHVVVYGRPAIVAGLGAGATAAVHPHSEATLSLTSGATGERVALVSSSSEEPLGRAYRAILEAFSLDAPLRADVVLHLPAGAGLGSSAAIAVAVARSLQNLVNANEQTVSDAVAASEAVFHGNASGVDQAAALRGGLFRFVKPNSIEPLSTVGLRLLVCQAAQGASTSAMVSGVRALHTAQTDVVESIFDAAEKVVDDAIDALRSGDKQRLGALMSINHGLLCALGVSAPALDDACHVAVGAGAFGAKLTGAGGGGCVFAVADEKHEQDVLDAWAARSWHTFSFDLERSADL